VGVGGIGVGVGGIGVGVGGTGVAVGGIDVGVAGTGVGVAVLVSVGIGVAVAVGVSVGNEVAVGASAVKVAITSAAAWVWIAEMSGVGGKVTNGRGVLVGVGVEIGRGGPQPTRQRRTRATSAKAVEAITRQTTCLDVAHIIPSPVFLPTRVEQATGTPLLTPPALLFSRHLPFHHCLSPLTREGCSQFQFVKLQRQTRPSPSFGREHTRLHFHTTTSHNALLRCCCDAGSLGLV